MCIKDVFNKLPEHFQSSQCHVLNVRRLRILPMKCGATVSLLNGVKTDFFAWAILCP